MISSKSVSLCLVGLVLVVTTTAVDATTIPYRQAESRSSSDQMPGPTSAPTATEGNIDSPILVQRVSIDTVSTEERTVAPTEGRSIKSSKSSKSSKSRSSSDQMTGPTSAPTATERNIDSPILVQRVGIDTVSTEERTVAPTERRSIKSSKSSKSSKSRSSSDLVDPTSNLLKLQPQITLPDSISRCRISKLGEEDYVDALAALERGWILAEFTSNSETIRCLDCREMNFSNCYDVQCFSTQSCSGSYFSIDDGEADARNNEENDAAGNDDTSNVHCIGIQSCKGAIFRAIDHVTCVGLESCATSRERSSSFDVGSVECRGDASCIGAIFGSSIEETKEVTCGGVESCRDATSFEVGTMNCAGARSCVGSNFMAETRRVACTGEIACDRSQLTGAKKLSCGSTNSCFGMYWN